MQLNVVFRAIIEYLVVCIFSL